MKRLLLVASVLFGIGFAYGASLAPADAGPCYYRCICGVPHKCCMNNGVETCKPAPNGPLQCPHNPC